MLSKLLAEGDVIWALGSVPVVVAAVGGFEAIDVGIDVVGPGGSAAATGARKGRVVRIGKSGSELVGQMFTSTEEGVVVGDGVVVVATNGGFEAVEERVAVIEIGGSAAAMGGGESCVASMIGAAVLLDSKRAGVEDRCLFRNLFCPQTGITKIKINRRIFIVLVSV